MDHVLSSKPPCPGIRFYPTDEELFMYHLRRKVMGKSFPCQIMSDVDVYRFAPWDLPGKSCLKTRDLYWYFFCPRVKKYSSGTRAHRLTEFGFWKSTGVDRTVQSCGRTVGKIKTLIFHRGKPPGGDRTNWVMHEYKLEDQLLDKEARDSYVICKIYEKSGWGPKNGEQYGARFLPEEWESDDDNNVQTDQEPVPHPENVGPSENVNFLSTPGLAPSMEQLTASVTATCTPSTTTDPTATIGTERAAPDEPLADNDCFNGLEDLFGPGSHSGFIELDDFCHGLQDLDAPAPQPSAADFDWSLFKWPQQPDDFPGFLELNDLN